MLISFDMETGKPTVPILKNSRCIKPGKMAVACDRELMLGLLQLQEYTLGQAGDSATA